MSLAGAEHRFRQRQQGMGAGLTLFIEFFFFECLGENKWK